MLKEQLVIFLKPALRSRCFRRFGSEKSLRMLRQRKVAHHEPQLSFVLFEQPLKHGLRLRATLAFVIGGLTFDRITSSISFVALIPRFFASASSRRELICKSSSRCRADLLLQASDALCNQLQDCFAPEPQTMKIKRKIS